MRFSKEHKENLSKAWIKRKSNGNGVSWNKGKKNHYNAGENHYYWKGGLPKCKNCGKQLKNYYAERCLSCRLKKELHWNWQGGKTNNKLVQNNLLKQWRLKNPLSVKTSNNKRRLLTSTLTIETVQEIYEKNIEQYGTLTCYLCKKTIKFRQDSLEHKIPISRGGTNSKDNLAVAHRSCNCKKNTKTATEFIGGRNA
jgi:5-methylcytosine-specific restriction endonuclease McrA